jgi:polar amino acid transport system substrate-binding protein
MTIERQLLKLAVAISLLTICLDTRSVIAAEWSKIQKRGQIAIAVKNNLRPLAFIDRSGKLAGLEIDIAHRLAEELLGDREAVDFHIVNNRNRLSAVLDDRVDIAIANIGRTTSRARIVDFSPYYYLDGTSLVTKQDNSTDLANFTQARIAVLKGSSTIAVIRHQFPQVRLIGVDSYQEALEVLATDTADAFAGDRTVLTGWIQEYPEYYLLPAKFSGAALSIVMPKGLQYQELREKIKEAIDRWHQSGWLQKRIKYWGL